MNYIGIKGHRGAGKSSLSYLIGKTISYIHKRHADPTQDVYNEWVMEVMKDENIIHHTPIHNVYFDSFSTQVYTFIQLLLGCKGEDLYSDDYKDSMCVNLKTLTLQEINSTIKLTSRKDVYEMINKEGNPRAIHKDIYITLRDFIIYFGLDVMQRFLGTNVWVKVTNNLDRDILEYYESYKNMYKIMADIKTSAEISYIKQREGVIVEIVRPSNKKGKSDLSEMVVESDTDFKIVVMGDLQSTRESVINTSNNIIEYFKGKKRDE